jgi:LCP family protein required for cell wall assembly
MTAQARISPSYGSGSNTTAMPVRNPNVSSQSEMTKRAWWLIVLNVLIPGSAQSVAGGKKLGRFGLFFTLVLWAIAIITLILWAVARTVLFDIATSVVGLTVIQLLLAFYAILWIVLTLDTLRLTRLIKAVPAARVAVAIVSIAMLVMTAGVATRGAFIVGAARSAISGIFSSNQQYADPVDGRYNILLMGGDAGPDRVGLRPDSLSVVSVNATTGQTTMIGIPRNMQMAPFSAGSPMLGPYPKGYDCGDACLISYLYTYGQANQSLYPDAVKDGSQPGIEATKDAVEGVLGIKIQYYALIDMEGFSDMINALGGITIAVTEKLPIGGGIGANGQPVGTHRWIYPGTQKMSGFTAQWYVRSRHGDSDYDRMARQRQVEGAMLAQFSPEVVLSKFEDIAKAGKQVVKTDIPQSMLGRFVELASDSRKKTPSQLELVPPYVYEPNPDFAQIHSMVTKALKKPGWTPKTVAATAATTP